jgi:hypothetical protein
MISLFYMRPMVTGPPFFPLFFIASFCLFCPKVNPRCSAQPFLLLCSCPSSIYYAGNPYLSIFGYGAKKIPPSVFAPSPHPHLVPRGGGVPAIPVDGAVNYILSVLQRALLLPDIKRTARMCCSRNRIKLNH